MDLNKKKDDMLPIILQVLEETQQLGAKYKDLLETIQCRLGDCSKNLNIKIRRALQAGHDLGLICFAFTDGTEPEHLSTVNIQTKAPMSKRRLSHAKSKRAKNAQKRRKQNLCCVRQKPSLRKSSHCKKTKRTSAKRRKHKSGS